MKKIHFVFLTIVFCMLKQYSFSQSTVGHGAGLTFNTYNRNGVYELYDSPRNITTSAILPLNLHTDNNNIWAESTDPVEEYDMINAHWAAEVVYDYWKNVHLRNGYDGNNAQLTILTNNGIGGGSFRSGTIYCGRAGYKDPINGYNIYSSSYANLQIIAHEFTHGVIEKTCNLGFDGAGGEAGAMNEGICDFFAMAIQQSSSWVFGNGLMRINGSPIAIRYLADPKRADAPEALWGSLGLGYPRAEKLGDDIWNQQNETYRRAGPMTFALYLITVGKTGVVAGIGFEKTSKIVYRALMSGDLNNTSGYNQMKVALLNAALYLYGPSAEYAAVGAAFNYINVGSASPTTQYWVTAKNNFDTGVLTVDGVPNKASGSGFDDYHEGTFHTVEAVDQFESNQQYFRVWNTGTNPSLWHKKISTNPSIPISNAYNRVLGIQLTSNWLNSSIISDHKRRFNIFVNQQTEFDGTINGSTPSAQIVESNTGSVSTPLQLTVNRTYQFGGWTNGTRTNSYNITNPTDNQTLTALYKLPFHSNSINAFANNSARKVVRTPDGYYHLVYESMGYVWHEKLTKTGSVVFCQPISLTPAKNPSIGIMLDGQMSQVIVVYQENNNGNSSIKMAIINSDGSTNTVCTVTDTDHPYDENMNPVIAGPFYYDFMVVWQQSDMGEWISPGGLYCMLGAASSEENGWAIEWYTSYGGMIIDNTNGNSKNPAIAYNTQNSQTTFQLTWQQDVDQYNSSIQYQTVNFDGAVHYGTLHNVSYGCGYSHNMRPSIIAATPTGARISWIATDDDLSTETLFRDPDYPSFWDFGANVTSQSINISSNRYVIGWSEGETQFFTDNRTLSDPMPLSSTGKDIQITNGATGGSMYAVGFNTSLPPYSFTISDSMQKFGKNPGHIIANGRVGILSKDKAQFTFGVGNIKVDGTVIKFTDMPDTALFPSVSAVNKYMESKPFTLTDQSVFKYTVQYGVTDSTAAIAALGSTGEISYRIELVDNATDQVLGTYDNITLTASHVVKYANIAYNVSTAGIGTKSVRLRLIVKDNISPIYTMANKHASGSVFLQKGAEETKIEYNKARIVTEFALAQNYPNPFNPSTTISYAIPEAGVVTVKVFDILGKEVATLVNEYKSEGRYNIAFDASRLSSGIYIYRIQAGKYSATRKMQLLK